MSHTALALFQHDKIRKAGAINADGCIDQFTKYIVLRIESSYTENINICSESGARRKLSKASGSNLKTCIAVGNTNMVNLAECCDYFKVLLYFSNSYTLLCSSLLAIFVRRVFQDHFLTENLPQRTCISRSLPTLRANSSKFSWLARLRFYYTNHRQFISIMYGCPRQTRGTREGLMFTQIQHKNYLHFIFPVTYAD